MTKALTLTPGKVNALRRDIERAESIRVRMPAGSMLTLTSGTHADTCYLCGGLVDRLDNVAGAQGRPKAGPCYPVLEHVHALANGGADAPDNWETAHAECNGRKGVKPLEALALPMPFPKGYDEARIRARAALIAEFDEARETLRAWGTVSYHASNDAECERRKALLERRTRMLCSAWPKSHALDV